VQKPQVIVVGAGAAGIIAAWRAATLGARVLLLEKTPRLGTKILISGGGKCNITHDGDLRDVLRAFRKNEATFIRPACYRFTNKQIVEMLTGRGLRVYTRADGRIFPVDRTAKDVVAILESYLTEVGVEIGLNTPVTGLLSDGSRINGVCVQNADIKAQAVIVSVGGSSYPNSGTTGDGWKWARDLGHTIVKVQAALAPIYLAEAHPDRSGVSLRDCVLKARLNGKEIARWRGDLLFTHQGVSGPTVLGISRVVAENERMGDILLEVDLVPDKTFEALSSKLQKHVSENPKKLLGSYAEQFAPNRLVDDLLMDASVDSSTPGPRVDKKSRNRLIEVLKAWKLGTVRIVPLEKGEVVAGGISLGEVDPQTMESKKVKGLFLCGEVLDIAGPVGGYNLQAAFATGYVAGETVAKTVQPGD
jgi:predicted Rossmann fold flavoprotein